MLQFSYHTSHFLLCVLVSGIVRGVDPVKKELYIVTSVDLPSLKNVNTLLKGSVTLPEQLLMKQVRLLLNFFF